MSILGITIPMTLLLAGGLLWLVLRAVQRGEFDDWEGPAARHFLDDDSRPEGDADRAESYSMGPESAPGSSGSPPEEPAASSRSGR